MEIQKISNKSYESKILFVLTMLFIGLMFSAWVFSYNLRNQIIAKNSVENAGVQAIVEISKLRNLSESEISNGLSFFLMGSSNLFDERKKDRLALSEALIEFEKKYNLPEIPAILKRIDGFRTQQEEFFDQGMDYRAKKTESKIVGQFYRSKTSPLRTNINKALNEILALHNADFERSQALAQKSATEIESQIPGGMMWFTALISLLFLGIIFLVLRLLSQRKKQTKERDRLFHAAQIASQTRDEILAAVSQDFNEPLQNICETVTTLKNTSPDSAQVINSTVLVIQDRIKDILDETKFDMNALNLRVEQTSLDSIFDEAKLWLEPIAKQKDIKLEFNPINPPVLAFIDRERILRVLANLIGNSIKFSPRNSKIIIKVRSDQQFILVSIKDSGGGIPEKQLPQIFDTFWQAQKTADQGSGFGLSVVKKIITAHGGTVTVESHIGHGSTFTFSIPSRRPSGALLKKPAAPVVRNS